MWLHVHVEYRVIENTVSGLYLYFCAVCCVDVYDLLTAVAQVKGPQQISRPSQLQDNKVYLDLDRHSLLQWMHSCWPSALCGVAKFYPADPNQTAHPRALHPVAAPAPRGLEWTGFLFQDQNCGFGLPAGPLRQPHPHYRTDGEGKEVQAEGIEKVKEKEGTRIKKSENHKQV